MANKHEKLKDMPELTPEEMKAIGEIELGPSRHEQFLNAHYKKLIVATLVIMLLAAAAIIYGTYRARQEAEASGLLLQALGVTDQSTEAQGNFDQAALERIIRDYPGTQSVGAAQMLRGMQLVVGGEEKQGIEELQRVALRADDSFVRLRAQAYLAGHYMRAGNSDKATELWQAVSRAGNSPYHALALLSLGDMAQKSGDEQGARAYYTQIAEQCPASPLLVAAQQRLLILGVDSPKPVAPPENEQKTGKDAKGELLFPGLGSPLQ